MTGVTFCFHCCLRVAVEFLDSRTFCKNSHHMKGEALMRKRHLEILGYRVVQVRKHSFLIFSSLLYSSLFVLNSIKCQ